MPYVGETFFTAVCPVRFRGPWCFLTSRLAPRFNTSRILTQFYGDSYTYGIECYDCKKIVKVQGYGSRRGRVIQHKNGSGVVSYALCPGSGHHLGTRGLDSCLQEATPGWEPAPELAAARVDARRRDQRPLYAHNVEGVRVRTKSLPSKGHISESDLYSCASYCCNSVPSKS